MALFQPCQGKSSCRDDGSRCLTCGRTLVEIQQLRDGLDLLATLALDYHYDNSQDYCDYISRKLEKKIAARRESEGEVSR
ncbi:MAG: hypothetical protein HQL48_04425 [Gammaproteobacteria bacterium]|nr:hypothetical protein [Gammaproteobacteria bacterium]